MPIAPAAVETWVFDLDNTLYPAGSSLFPQIDRRMKLFIADLLGLSIEDAHVLQKDYYRTYGTTLRGLMEVHGVQPGPFMDFVHDIDHSVLSPCPRLDAALAALPGRKLIHTNGSRRHAEQVLKQLGLTRHFEAIFDIEAAGFVPKPQAEGYHALLARHAVDPTRALMVEDIHRNLRPAAALGMTTVWVREDDHPDGPCVPQDESDLSHVDHVTDDLAGWLAQAASPAGIVRCGRLG
mgnify:CR=1 FL=1